MREASKTNRIRGAGFVPRYLQGKAVLDIGCGPDLVVPWAEPFDLADGDANQIASLRPAESYDVVHSSHCLEHMHHPRDALAQWWGLVRPGGFLITVVPDEELYEQGLWPSMFNGDHKWAFTIDPGRLWAPHVMDLRALHLQLANAVLIDLQKHDVGYRRDLLEATRSNLSARNFARYRRVLESLRACKLDWLGLDRVGWPWLARRGIPLDQTSKDAMAQLQVIVQKQP
jgi:SAM-dependent methyltransferase